MIQKDTALYTTGYSYLVHLSTMKLFNITMHDTIYFSHINQILYTLYTTILSSKLFTYITVHRNRI